MRSSVAPVAFVLACLSGCGGISPEAKDAGTTFRLASNILTELHLETFGGTGTAPTMVVKPCDTGDIDMTVVGTDFEGGNVDLLHAFRSCSLEGRMLTGQLDYLDVRLCSGGGVELRITGALTVDGDASNPCEIVATEHCDGMFSGTTCGFDLTETGLSNVR